eukprot:762765-Hanusia_phi.AAC.2
MRGPGRDTACSPPTVNSRIHQSLVCCRQVLTWSCDLLYGVENRRLKCYGSSHGRPGTEPLRSLAVSCFQLGNAGGIPQQVRQHLSSPQGFICLLCHHRGYGSVCFPFFWIRCWFAAVEQPQWRQVGWGLAGRHMRRPCRSRHPDVVSVQNPRPGVR